MTAAIEALKRTCWAQIIAHSNKVELAVWVTVGVAVTAVLTGIWISL